MSKHTIRFSLTTEDIDRAIRDVKAFKKEFANKVDNYRKRISEEIAVQASSLFASSITEDRIIGISPKPDVKVTVEEQGKMSVVIVKGNDAVWIEFGAGVYHNGSAGTSPHPNGVELGLTIGSYGKGHGRQTSWGYYDEETNEVIVTRGTPATMPLYNSAKKVAKKAIDIAREVFR